MLTHMKWTIVVLHQFLTALQCLTGTGASAVTLYENYTPDYVVELTDSNFDELVLNSDKSWFVNFYSPQCGFCLDFEPKWAEASRILANSTTKAKLGSLDILKYEVKQTEHQIEYTPSIRYFPPGSKGPSDAEAYRSSRKPQDLVAFVLNKIGNSTAKN